MEMRQAYDHFISTTGLICGSDGIFIWIQWLLKCLSVWERWVPPHLASIHSNWPSPERLVQQQSNGGYLCIYIVYEAGNDKCTLWSDKMMNDWQDLVPDPIYDWARLQPTREDVTYILTLPETLLSHIYNMSPYQLSHIEYFWYVCTNCTELERQSCWLFVVTGCTWGDRCDYLGYTSCGQWLQTRWCQ